MPESSSDGLRSALRLGAGCIAVGIVAGAWELLARQAPSSPWHVAGFPVAIERFSMHAWLIGLAVLVIAPRAWRSDLASNPSRARSVLAAASAGAVLALGALMYSAATGVLGMQLRESSAGSYAVLVIRLAGNALLVAALYGSRRGLVE